MIGVLYVLGHGVEQDTQTGVTWLTTTAEKGSAEARLFLEAMIE